MYANPYHGGVPIYLRVRECRHALGLTQAELAARAGVRRATVSRLENSRVTAVDLVVLGKLADTLGVEPGFLLSRTPPRLATNSASE
jgi:transcriptional regulator with XRE-family HTH domain